MEKAFLCSSRHLSYLSYFVAHRGHTPTRASLSSHPINLPLAERHLHPRERLSRGFYRSDATDAIIVMLIRKSTADLLSSSDNRPLFRRIPPRFRGGYTFITWVRSTRRTDEISRAAVHGGNFLLRHASFCASRSVTRSPLCLIHRHASREIRRNRAERGFQKGKRV